MLVYNAVFLLTIILSIAIVNRRVRLSRRRLPPGPIGHVLFGVQSRDIGDQPWKTYTTWSKRYGPLTYFRMARRQFLVLSSVQAVTDLLEKRASIYSDRPRKYVWDEIVGRKHSVFNISSRSERFRKYRRMMGSGLNSKAIQEYTQFFERENQVMLQALHKDPGNFAKLLRRNAGATIMQITYGYHVTRDDDPFIEIVETNNALSAKAMAPGRYLVDSFPFLRFIPSWFPGAHFHAELKEFQLYLNRENEIPYRWVREQMAKGAHDESFVSRLVLPPDGQTLSWEEEDCIKWTAAGLYSGGADTTVSAMLTFFMAMVLYPNIQRRAQDELASLLSKGQEEDCICRLSRSKDRGKLPYVEALIKEVLRWGSVAPVALPHSLVQDDEYMGYRIPKGTTVIANIWALMQDPCTYPNPEAFNPERFLSANQPDPRSFVFGFGRRMCPGQQFAELSLFLQITSILATYNIFPYLDWDGKEILPVREYVNGIVTHPVAFKCKIVPRSEATLSTLCDTQY